jgi:hypothetical protein
MDNIEYYWCGIKMGFDDYFDTKLRQAQHTTNCKIERSADIAFSRIQGEASIRWIDMKIQDSNSILHQFAFATAMLSAAMFNKPIPKYPIGYISPDIISIVREEGHELEDLKKSWHHQGYDKQTVS